jgi:CRISPR-associated endonuclease/helicase Cas3
MADKSNNAAVSDLNRLRADILYHVRGKAHEPAGLFTLTVPTGGGKTLASLGFALDHAKAHDLRRIVYAIPFTSIIDQNAAVFRKVLGDDYVLEHHSSIDEDTFNPREQRDKLKLAMEDWAAPIVVTTNVQLFESLFANRPSHCRKLHNLSNSILILDEAQTLPLKFLRPCMAALDELARHYRATIILCTATQPALDKRDFKHGGLELAGRELAPDPALLAQTLKRVKITTGHVLDDDALIKALFEQSQALVIVNSRKHALNLYKMAKQCGLDGVIHLTTRQYAAERRKILDRVRQTLEDEKPCRLIATSLVEAGVDIDFPRVWRAEAGLDQIAQAAGRCNREGKRPLEDSIVTIFKAKDHPPPREIVQLAADFTRIADGFDDLLSPEAMTAYFKEVYWRKGAEQLDEKKILSQFNVSAGQTLFNYKTAAQDFQMIESGLLPVIINETEAVQTILDRLNFQDASPGKAARDLQAYIVQVPPKDLNIMRANGRVTFIRPDLWGNQFTVLADPSLYQPDVGLVWENADILENSIY